METLERIEAPAPVVSLEEAKAFLRVTDGDSAVISDDVLITSLIETATAYLDGEAGYLDRAIGVQRWRYSHDGFPRAGIVLPLPPLRSVETVTCTLRSGTTVALAAPDFRVMPGGSEPGRVLPAGMCPVLPFDVATVTVEFTAGYDPVPEPIRSAILMHVATLYENRESVTANTTFTAVPFAGLDLVMPYQRAYFG